jgi:hypothetical protein
MRCCALCSAGVSVLPQVEADRQLLSPSDVRTMPVPRLQAHSSSARYTYTLYTGNRDQECLLYDATVACPFPSSRSSRPSTLSWSTIYCGGTHLEYDTQLRTTVQEEVV